MCWESNIREKEEGAVELGEAMCGKHLGDGVGWFSWHCVGTSLGTRGEETDHMDPSENGQCLIRGMMHQWLCLGPNLNIGQP